MFDVPVGLLGPECRLKTRPKSDVAGDVLALRLVGSPLPEVVVDAPPGMAVDRVGPDGEKLAIDLRLEPNIDDPAASRRVRVKDAKTGGVLIDLEIPIAAYESEPTEQELTKLASEKPVAIFTMDHANNGHNFMLHPGDVFRVVLPESPGERWLSNPEAFASPWWRDTAFQLLASDLEPAPPTSRGTGTRVLKLRVRPDALDLHKGSAPTALGLMKLKRGETYEDWTARRGGSGADYHLSLLISPK
jgi:hypothetical protein